MRFDMRSIQKAMMAALAAAAMLCGAVTHAESRTSARLLDARVQTVSASLAGCEAIQPTCGCYKPCVTYRGCFDCCGPKVSQVLMVKDPCDCSCNPCAAEIPVCLPACCKTPCVNCKCGLLGRGIVTYSYDCGACVTVVFRNCGDVVVVYRG
jgi:hypothetical protein